MILLEKLRKERGISQRRLWMATGVDIASISKAERNRALSVGQLKRLADYLGYSGDCTDLMQEVEK